MPIRIVPECPRSVNVLDVKHAAASQYPQELDRALLSVVCFY